MYDDGLLLLEQVNATSQDSVTAVDSSKSKNKHIEKTVSEFISQASLELQERYDDLRTYIEALGDDVQMTVRKFYIAFRRIKNFACVEVHTQHKTILIYVKSDFEDVIWEQGFTRDLRNIGHYGTGDLEITLRFAADLERAKPYIQKSYDMS